MKTPTEIKAEIEKEIIRNRKAKEDKVLEFDLSQFSEKAKAEIENIISRDYFWIDKEKQATLSGLILAWENEISFLEELRKKQKDCLSQFAYSGGGIPKTEIKRISAESDGFRQGVNCEFIKNRILELKQAVGDEK